ERAVLVEREARLVAAGRGLTHLDDLRRAAGLGADDAELRGEVGLESVVGAEGVDRGVELAAHDLGFHVELAPVLLAHVLVDELAPELLEAGPPDPLDGPLRFDVARPGERPPEADAPAGEDRLLRV